MTRLATLLLLPLLVLAALGCGEREAEVGAPVPERLTLVLDYFANADHAGIYAADFRRAGLDVDVQVPSDASAPLKLLAGRRADVAITYQPELLLARERGEDVVAIGALVQRPLNSLISLGAVRRPEDLRGAKVGVSGTPADEALLRAVAAKAGVPFETIEQVRVGFNLVPALLSERVDAVLGAYWNIEGAELERRGERPVILRLDEIGVPSYDELVFVARRDALRTRGPVLRRFLRAVAQGHQVLRRDPAAGTTGLKAANPDLREVILREQVERTLPVFFPAERDQPFGFMDPAQWRRYAVWMAENRLLRSPAANDRSFTNEFLPGEGARPGEDTPAG